MGVEVPGHRPQQLTQTVIVWLLKTHFFTLILDCEKSTEYNSVFEQTCDEGNASDEDSMVLLT